MAMINWIYQNLDERRMSQRRQAAEMALRSAMKSGKSPLHISHSVSRPKVSKGYETVAHVQINTGMLSIASAA